jgi:hypothetical protein
MDEERKRFEAWAKADGGACRVNGDWAFGGISPYKTWLAAKADAKAQAEAAVEPFKITASAAMAMTDDDLTQALLVHFGRQIENIQRAVDPCNADAMAIVLRAASRASTDAVAQIRRVGGAPTDTITIPSLVRISAA